MRLSFDHPSSVNFGAGRGAHLLDADARRTLAEVQLPIHQIDDRQVGDPSPHPSTCEPRCA